MCIIDKAVVIAGLNVAERRPARYQQGNAGKAWRDSNRQGGEWRGKAGKAGVERLGGACPSVAWQGWQGTTRHGKVK